MQKNKVIVFDLEATCEKDDRNYPKEIIEIGAVDNNGNEFDKFVKPIARPKLTEFCKNLTTINQSNIDNADRFPQVYKEFLQFIQKGNPETITLFSWGAYDKRQLLNDLELNNVTEGKNLILQNHQNLKEYFHDKKGYWPKGMKRVLKELHLPLDGTHHRGIDDSKNIMKIYKNITEEQADGR